ncbi:ADP-ribose glycohydrolase MACROD2 isoform X2 [Electrophorus electricus]|uniref:ADP-ribose glycohydrolase MACROD2 isoform X2 n=1 Tax=Electrophorus electricus TaxID=8005 RepID=UPI0015CF9D8B|nr:ADP-ribose glycohydrolase MACROD2 isoform X2 [Electrophorus electricus]
MSKKKREWRTEKERLLSLGQEERRKEYGSNYLALDKIPTWRQHVNNTAPEEEEEHPISLCDKVSLYKGDITILEVDAIVNAVDGCIHRAAGHFLYEECRSLNGCDTGSAKLTCGYDLPAKYVIHTVGPIARGTVGPSQSRDLRSCYETSLRLMEENKLHSVAFPCISTGIYGFPNEPAAVIALRTVRDWLKENTDEVDRVIFCVFLETDYEIYKRKMSDFFSPDKQECEKQTESQPEDGDEQPTCEDMEKLSQGAADEDMEDVDTPNQTPENDVPGDENSKEKKEIPAEKNDPVEAERSAGESKPEEDKERQGEKKEDSEDGAERETCTEEKIPAAHADQAQTEQERDGAKCVGLQDNESQGGMESMEVEGDLDGDKNIALAEDTDMSKVETQCQNVKPQEPNQAAQTDSSDSKDGAMDKSEPKKA